MLQTHINLSANDKIFLGTNYMKSDYNQGIYEFEYSKKFDRLDTCVKYATTGMFSLSTVTTIAKNFFLGVEITANVSINNLFGI